MFNFILAIQIIVAIAMVGLILLQHGKGADAGASFGSGASGTVFGAAGSANFLTRATAVLTAIFFATSLLLAIQARKIETDQRRLDVSEIETPKPALEPIAKPSETETVEDTTETVEVANVDNTKTEEVAEVATENTDGNATTETVETQETASQATPEMTEEKINQELATITEETEELTGEAEKSE